LEAEELIELQNKVRLLRAEGKYEETIEQSNILLYNGNQQKDYKFVLIAYMNLAASYYCISDIEEALNNIYYYEEICDVHGDETDKLQAYNVLFLLYEYNKNFNKAKQTLDRTIVLGKKLKKYNILSNAYSNYSHINLLEKDYEKALEMSKSGLEIAELHKPDSPILKLRVKLNIAKSYIKLSNFTDSKIMIDEMINAPILDSFPREKAQCFDLQSHWYSAQGLYSEAFHSLDHAKNIMETLDDVYFFKEIQEERCRLCELLGDISLGFQVQKEYIALLSEINNRELNLTAKKMEIKYNMALIEKKAYTDHLTGVYNRDYLESTANLWLKQANKKNESVSCILLDIDNFKSLNDGYGHLLGDEVIRQICKVCSNMIRENDILGRFGGDEFLIILKGATLEQASKKAEQIRKAIRDITLEKDGELIPISASFGIADSMISPAQYFNELFSCADQKLYKAKQNGKNRIY
jgi:diguanylate cyclase (GGDEF)-like protein